MSCLNPWPKGQSFQKSTITPGKVERHNRKADRARALEDAYEVVNRRDAGRCRVSGVALVAASPDAKVRREHHHIISRSRSRALREQPSNIMLCSALAHDLIEKCWIDVEGTDANGPLFFHWTSLATSRPLKIQRHNAVSPPERSEE
jgi:hypothetical protein